MVYAVIDTNVFVSAYMTHNPKSATSIVVDCMFRNRIVPLYNDEILAEYTEVLSRSHFRISQEERQGLFDFIRQCGIYAERAKFDELFIDESDRVFYEIALSKEDSFLVTGNLKHYPIDPRIVTPAEMLHILGVD